MVSNAYILTTALVDKVITLDKISEENYGYFFLQNYRIDDEH